MIKSTQLRLLVLQIATVKSCYLDFSLCGLIGDRFGIYAAFVETPEGKGMWALQ
jgi:hypothetical protein